MVTLCGYSVPVVFSSLIMKNIFLISVKTVFDWLFLSTFGQIVSFHLLTVFFFFFFFFLFVDGFFFIFGVVVLLFLSTLSMIVSIHFWADCFFPLYQWLFLSIFGQIVSFHFWADCFFPFLGRLFLSIFGQIVSFLFSNDCFSPFLNRLYPSIFGQIASTFFWQFFWYIFFIFGRIVSFHFLIIFLSTYLEILFMPTDQLITIFLKSVLMKVTTGAIFGCFPTQLIAFQCFSVLPSISRIRKEIKK